MRPEPPALFKGRHISAKYDVSHSAVQRHKTNCLANQVAKARADSEEFSAEALIRTMQDVKKKAYEIYERNAGVDDSIAIKALQRIDGTVQTSARIVQVIQERQQANGGQSRAEILMAARKRHWDANAKERAEQEAKDAELKRLRAVVNGRAIGGVIEAEIVDAPETE